MATATIIPLAEYLETSYRPDCDYLEGELLERNVGELDHSLVQGLLLHYLMNRQKQWGIRILPEQRVQVKARRYRVPDFTVVAGGLPAGPILIEPPFLCIEVLSPSDRMAEMQERIDDYLSFGVTYVWIINPKTRRGSIYTHDGMHDVKDGVLTTVDPDIRVPLFELE